MEREAGFTLVETLAGAAIAVVIVWGLLVFAGRTIAAAASADARVEAVANADRLIERLSSEAASSWAVYVPTTDALGASNGDGHEIDFFTQDGAHRTYSWAYTFDAATKTLTRYALAPGNPPVAGDTIGGIDAFSASAATVGDLGSPASAAYDPLFASANATDVPFTFTAMPGAIGGNRVVALAIAASGVDRNVVLASDDAPTAFTVVVNYTPSPTPVVTPTVTPLTIY
ncbi:MAG TPA: type II secretion system protein [Candidatus Acidoferrales bacterium]|nr:type II secretion system protein [Candidatus Acidoferrales bacterium]